MPQPLRRRPQHLVCPSCDHRYEIISGDWSELRGQVTCGYCDTPMATPPKLTVIKGGQA